MSRKSFDLSFVEYRTLPTLHISYLIIMILDYERLCIIHFTFKPKMGTKLYMQMCSQNSFKCLKDNIWFTGAFFVASMNQTTTIMSNEQDDEISEKLRCLYKFGIFTRSWYLYSSCIPYLHSCLWVIYITECFKRP